MIAHEFTYDYYRQKVVDYLEIMPKGNYLSILSSPKFVSHNIFNMIEVFDIKVWILLIALYIIIYSINSIGTKTGMQKIFIAIDYLIILMGKGIMMIKTN